MRIFARHSLLLFALAATLLFLVVPVSGVGLKAPCKTCTCHGKDQSKYLAPTLTPRSRKLGKRSVAVWARYFAFRGGWRRSKRTVQDLRVAWVVRPT
jgi:hypothetical protein